MKYISIFFLFFLSNCTLFSVQKPTEPPTPKVDVVARAVNNTVAILHEDGFVNCSGVAVEAFIFTAEHCLEGAHRVRYLNTEHKFVVSLTWEDRDLAILQLIGKRMKDTVPLALQEPVLGQKAVWTGYPLGLGLVLSTGVVGSPRSDSGELVISGQILPGTSGGPVFDETGKLMGIISSTLYIEGFYNPQYLPIGYAVHWSTLKEALEAMN